MNTQTYQIRRNRSLYRLRKFRALQAPTLIIRYEQLWLWSLRQRTTDDMAAKDLPGFNENYRKFVLIHEHKGEA